MDRDIRTEVIGSLTFPSFNTMFEQSRRVYSAKAVSPTVHTAGGGNLELKIIEVYEIQNKARPR